VHVAGALDIDLSVHLSGSRGPRDGTPPVSGFLLPGDDGLFGGWEIQIDRRSDTPGMEPLRSGRDARTGAEEHAAPQSVPPADLIRGHRLGAPAVLAYDLSESVGQIEDPLRRAVILREAASLLRSPLHTRPEFAANPVFVVYDRAAGLGMWVVTPLLSKMIVKRRIAIRLNLDTGMTTVL